MEVNPQAPWPLAPWPRISSQSRAADTQLCCHTVWALRSVSFELLHKICILVVNKPLWIPLFLCRWPSMFASLHVADIYIYIFSNLPLRPLSQNPISAGVKSYLWSTLKQQSALNSSTSTSCQRAIDSKTLTHTFQSSALGLMVVLGVEWWLANDIHTLHWCHQCHKSQCTFPPSSLSLITSDPLAEWKGKSQYCSAGRGVTGSRNVSWNDRSS